MATRWVIERSNAWMERCKSLVNHGETQPVFDRVNAQAFSP
nr:hypothetical protein [Microcoleus sp. PH2017_27_LUM_O_A]